LERIEKNVQYIKGVGPHKAKLLSKIGINTIEDIVFYFPRLYEDRRNLKKIASVENGEKVNLKVVLCGVPQKYRHRRNMSIIKVSARDDTGIIFLSWFNQNYITNNISIGDIIIVSGRIKRIGNQIDMQNPIFENYNESGKKTGRVVPIYPLTEGLSNNELTKIVEQTLDNYLDYYIDTIPQRIIDELELFSFKQSIKNIHFPEDRFSYKKAKERLVFEELLFLQLGLFIIKRNNTLNNKGIVFSKKDETKKLIELLPYKLTSAQNRVFNEIARDMESPKQMNRLIQGDVGSGKTIIAVLSMLKAYASGYQSVMMAPTEILAKQHYENVKDLFDKFNIRCELLTSNILGKQRKDVLRGIAVGDVHIVIGTHSVLQGNVVFHKLGLAITDEQHRFGVRQRATLSLKGGNPDVLVMTATPIPRTLALILYGDLQVSVIDELPAGRKRIKTYSINEEMKIRAYSFVREQINEGRQAYIVCPLVEESDTINAESANELYEILRNSVFSDLKLGLLHGQMKASEKDAIMTKFKNGKIDILVSTTVIEVGVSVPNASIMLIENAERFGLAQLHQLRGRVGRGEYQSYCILVNESKSKISKERMHIMERTNNGFLIAEKDLQIRGPGEFFGTKQHGLPDLRIANLSSDINTLNISQKVAYRILEEDPYLSSEEYRLIREKVLKLFNKESQLISFN